ncbi:Sds3-like-domain-containing protein [Coniella lustricola]|uniref:Sds3-like-domain-containing protein n=1 Tax=Coniella lustricola TaxID=2025994 RepID=A0A2T3A2G3_9PEZI|nr:Sds3-like-domain-containing protein [Coniella lustricola]
MAANAALSILDISCSDVSSPLSEIMDVTDSDDMDGDLKSNLSDNDVPVRPKPNPPTAPTIQDDPDSLSDIDSEASTERLYDTPRKTDGQPITTIRAVEEQESEPRKALRSLNRSPAKLQEQAQRDAQAESAGDDNDELSEASIGESEGDSEKGYVKIRKSTRSTIQKSMQSVAAASDELLTDSRKRKRLTLTEQVEEPERLQKRATSVNESSAGTSSLSNILFEGLGRTDSAEGRSAEQSEVEPDTVMKGIEDVAESVEKPTNELPTRSKKSKRSITRRRKGSVEEADATAEIRDTEQQAAEHQPAEEEPAEPAEIDEEAEIAHKNEEEIEKKRHAFEQLGTIEKQFAILRDRLYEERLAQLNEEQAQLEGDNPTHPEYLAMMQCIDSRRDDRLKVTELEYEFNMDALDRWAVSRRAQILSQFYQSVRESREKTLDELGKQWYEIQHERRKNANPIPDYGFRFPKTKALQKKQAIAHSKETSILAGIAQHHGFPAAPEMRAASQSEIEEDFEAMHRARQSIMGSVQQTPMANEFGVISFGRNLGPAGEQFLEQTPWANPKHPSHSSRRQSHGAYAGPPAFQPPSKTLQQHTGTAWFTNGQTNGDSIHKHSTPAEQDPGHARKPGEATKNKREGVVI